MSSDILRAYMKCEDTNPEIDGPFYELSSAGTGYRETVFGMWNCEVLTLGFLRGEYFPELRLRVIDPQKPVVLAVDNGLQAGFIFLDHHLEESASAGMRNYDCFKTDQFLVDCSQDRRYWSITSDGMTFVYGDVTFPDTWTIRDCDLLCAFIAGDLTANQLRMHACLSAREAVKEKRREEHIQRLAKELYEARGDAELARADLLELTRRYNHLVNTLRQACRPLLPFVRRMTILEVLAENERRTFAENQGN